MYLVYNNDLFLPNDSSLVNVFIFILFGMYFNKKIILRQPENKVVHIVISPPTMHKIYPDA